MIEWGNFLIVLAVSVFGACGIVALFALGLRLVSAGGGVRRLAGIASFVVCALAIVYGLYLIIPGI